MIYESLEEIENYLDSDDIRIDEYIISDKEAFLYD